MVQKGGNGTIVTPTSQGCDLLINLIILLAWSANNGLNVANAAVNLGSGMAVSVTTFEDIAAAKPYIHLYRRASWSRSDFSYPTI